MDADVRALTERELAQAREKFATADQALKLALIPKDEANENSVILEVRTDTGGEGRAQLWQDRNTQRFFPVVHRGGARSRL